jgi:DNA-binding beta-propeller fold protein YncE
MSRPTARLLATLRRNSNFHPTNNSTEVNARTSTTSIYWSSKCILRKCLSSMNMKNANILSIKLIVRLVTLSLALSIAIPLCAAEPHAPTPTPTRAFHVQQEWNLGGEGGWGFLCLDASTHQLYIPRTNHVMVVDTETGKVSGDVKGLTNARNIALDDSGRYGYVTDVTDGTSGFVRVIDRSTFKLVTSIPTGPIPYAIVFDPITKSMFVFNSRGHSGTVIDTATNQIIGTIPLSGRPGSAVGDGKGNVYVALPALGEIARIDASAKKITASLQLAPCTGPAGLAIDSARRQLFTACEDHKVVSVNADTGHVTSIGDAPANSGDINFDSLHNMLFIAGASGTLTIFHRDSSMKYSRLQVVKTQPGARAMIVSQQDARVYLVTSKFGQNTSAVSEELQFRPTPVPGTFSVIVVGR